MICLIQYLRQPFLKDFANIGLKTLRRQWNSTRDDHFFRYLAPQLVPNTSALFNKPNSGLADEAFGVAFVKAGCIVYHFKTAHRKMSRW